MKKWAPMRCSERGAIVPALLALLVIVVLVVVSVIYFVLGTVIPPNFIGIRQNYVGVPFLLIEGFESRGLQPGLHWEVPYVSRVIRVPRDFQVVSFNAQLAEQGEATRELVVPTTDGAKVNTDVSLIFRFYEEPLREVQREESGQREASDKGQKGIEVAVPLMGATTRAHGGPRELIATYGADRGVIISRFSEIAENALRSELGQLSTSDYYNPEMRERAALRAQEDISKAVAPNGIEVFATLIRRYVYAERNIDDQIFAKNLQDQTERMNAASSRLEEAKAETEKQRALGDANVRSLEVQGEADVRRRESEAKLYEASRQAEGDLEVAKAKAEVDAARAGALAQVEGADVYVGRELTPLLRSLAGGVVSGLDPYDVNAWADKLIGKTGAAQ